jgi:hypothetical protein
VNVYREPGRVPVQPAVPDASRKVVERPITSREDDVCESPLVLDVEGREPYWPRRAGLVDVMRTEPWAALAYAVIIVAMILVFVLGLGPA